MCEWSSSPSAAVTLSTMAATSDLCDCHLSGCSHRRQQSLNFDTTPTERHGYLVAYKHSVQRSAQKKMLSKAWKHTQPVWGRETSKDRPSKLTIAQNTMCLPSTRRETWTKMCRKTHMFVKRREKITRHPMPRAPRAMAARRSTAGRRRAFRPESFGPWVSGLGFRTSFGA